MKTIRFFALAVLMMTIGAVSASGQMMGKGPMDGAVPADIARMMQEPNKALAQASIQYMTAYTRALHTQASERKDRIDAGFITAAFAEMKRAHGMISRFQATHVTTMDEKMQEKVAPMMERMNRNLALVKNHLDALDEEMKGSRDLDRISGLTGEILKALDDMPGRPGGVRGQPGDGQQQMK